jgi:hypothetical protein
LEVGFGMEEVTGVLALGRGMEREDITRGRGLLGSMADSDGPGQSGYRETAARCTARRDRTPPVASVDGSAEASTRL